MVILKINQVKLEEIIVETQKEGIRTDKRKTLMNYYDNPNKNLTELNNNLRKDLNELDKRFNKKERDIGKLD